MLHARTKVSQCQIVAFILKGPGGTAARVSRTWKLRLCGNIHPSAFDVQVSASALERSKMLVGVCGRVLTEGQSVRLDFRFHSEDEVVT